MPYLATVMSMRAAPLLLAMSGISALAGAQGSRAGVIDGRVTDSALTAIAGADVGILGSHVQVTTGPNGRFRIADLPLGAYVLVVRRLGYEGVSYPVNMDAPDTLRLSIVLDPVAQTLDTMIVNSPVDADMTGFDARRKLGIGHFIGEAGIEASHATWVADLLRGIPSIQISQHGFDQVALNLRGGGCPMQIYLDGVRVQEVAGMSALSMLPPPDHLRGIEVYSGPSEIPLPYKAHNSRCGVILVWTKSAL